MIGKEVIYTKEEGVAKIVLNRPGQLNAINIAMGRELKEAITTAELDDEVRAVLLTGAGDAFCSGGDLAMLKEWTESSSAVVYRHMRSVGDIIQKLHSIQKPVITAVNGAAVGGGCSLALCGDIILASENARFGMAFSRYNLGPDMGGAYLLPRLVGLLRAKELIYSGRIIPADEALSYGMVSEVIERDRLMDEAESRAKKMARWATQALGMSKNILHESMAGASMVEILDMEAGAQAILFKTEDSAEAIKAFLENRKPEFSYK